MHNHDKSGIPRRIARRLREVLMRKIRPNLVLTARLNARLAKEYAEGTIRTVYDIGAHKGHWAAGLKALMPDAKLILFEANPGHAPDLELTGLQHYIGILSKPGVSECEFFSPESSAGSTGGSYYREVTPEFDQVDSVMLKAMTLAHIVESNKLPQPDLIKIDTQGSELDVMEGGSEVFKGANFILMELPVITYNSGAPDISAYLNRMDELGFLPIEISEVHKFGSIMIQLDFLFANKKLIDGDELSSLNIQSQ